MKINVAPVIKKVLPNGLTVLVNTVKTLPRVSINLWYAVGSKHEKSNEKGLAHLIEHMIFKGTTILSEVDIDTTTTRLSGCTNAFTSYDYTGYIFDFPSNAWKESLFLLADCMRNCRFDEQMLNSELSAVIQEMKLYKDDYFDTLLSRLSSAIFSDHPYHYPIIGFKQDLWNATRDQLLNFYKKHYVPNNATLVVVGNVDSEEVFSESEKRFGNILKNDSYEKELFYMSSDLTTQSVTLYRDVQQPQAAVAYVLPGTFIAPNNRYLYEVFACILGKGKSSRLYTKIVDDLQLASELHCSVDQRQDATLFDITFQPNTVENISVVIDFIQQEIQAIIEWGITSHELQRAFKQVKMSLLCALENYGDQAALIGESFLLSGDENLIFKELARKQAPDDFLERIQELLKLFFSAFQRHEGKIVPMTTSMADQWMQLQDLSDYEDERVLKERVRTIPVEAPRYAVSVPYPKDIPFVYPKPQKKILSNGVTVLCVDNPSIAKIDIVLSFSIREYDDPEDKQGLYRFLCDLLLEGTKKYPGAIFAQEVEGYGMTLSCQPGVIALTLLKEDLVKGLEFLIELLMHVEFTDEAIEKIRGHILADLSVYWDEPQEFCHQLAREIAYKKHPYSKDPQGTISDIKKITKQDLKDFYEYAFCSEGSTIAFVGDIEGYDIFKEVENAFSGWNRANKKVMKFPPLLPLSEYTQVHPIRRDQVVLLYIGHSITRLNPDYEKLLLFDQIFSGGVAGSLTSRLMRIREQTGLFYGISGSLIVGCDEQPGMIVIKTTISLDRLIEAQQTLSEVFKTVINSLTQEELEQAKKTLVSSLIDNFNSNKKIAGACLGIERFKLPADYFDIFASSIMNYSLLDVQEAACKILVPEKMVTLLIGRVK